MSDDARRLAAEARAVEEGHRAVRLAPNRYKVVSDTFATPEGQSVVYLVETTNTGPSWVFRCSCPNRQSRTPLCKHMQLVARRLEREGKATLVNGEWTNPRYDPAPPLTDEDDPFNHTYFVK